MALEPDRWVFSMVSEPNVSQGSLWMLPGALLGPLPGHSLAPHRVPKSVTFGVILVRIGTPVSVNLAKSCHNTASKPLKHFRYTHVTLMLHSCYTHVTLMLRSCYTHAPHLPLTCYSLAIHLLLTCYSLATHLPLTDLMWATKVSTITKKGSKECVGKGMFGKFLPVLT